jgi:large subunit ribosomal protein L29
MKTHEIKDLAPEDFAAHISDTRKEIVELRFQLAARKLENPAKLRLARRQLARLLTIQTQKTSKTASNTTEKTTAKK